MSSSQPSRSSSRHRHRRQRRSSPFRRQQLLAERLSLTTRGRRHGRRTAADDDRDARASVGESSSSRKRPFPSVASSGTLSPSEIKSDGMVGGGDSKNDRHIDVIDECEAWEEVSAIVPLLSYGEESNDLLSALLDFAAVGGGGVPPDGGADDGEKCDQCNGDIIFADDDRVIRRRKKRVLSSLSRALEGMLWAKHVMRRRNDCNNESTNFSPPQKKHRLAEEQMPQPTATNGVSTEILPWSVLLRITVRMASHVARQLHRRCECLSSERSSGAASGIKSEPAASFTELDELDGDGGTSDTPSSTHAVFRALDLVLADLNVLSRVQCRQPRDREGRKTGEETRTKRASPFQSQAPGKSHLPADRMVSAWKDRNGASRDAGREVWGPSRYAFLRDVESVAGMMSEMEEDTAGFDVHEWRERADSVVAALDECVRGELGDSSPHRDVGRRPTLAISPSLRRYGASPSRPVSLASITRAHVERVRSRTKAGGESRVGESPLIPIEPSSNVDIVGVNLQSAMDEERRGHLSICDDFNELEDAYRLAILFGCSAGAEDKLMRETIERRLNLLVEKLNIESHDMKSDGLNIDGAQSYLESLLRTLMKPSDPNVWLRLIEESRGRETPIMLRRGRASLVAFLVDIKAPGWKDWGHALESSPVPSYLGYLFANEDFQKSRTAGREEDAMDHRSSYFLPATDTGETNIPPSPIVTEVGLSLCVKKFLHKDTPEGNIQKHQSSSRSPGVNLFRNFGRLECQKSFSDASDILLSSVKSSLPDVNELTRDLFDLTLRFAADNDSEHENKPFPLRLVTPSASESLNIILQVASDHLQWLSPHSISSRYRFILQHIIQTFGENAIEKSNFDSDSNDGGFASWSQRAAFLIGVTKTANRGRMALYATQFLTLLCSKRSNDARKVFPSVERPHFYACLQLRQSSHFWNEMDKTARDLSLNIVARTFDLNFCARFLLPLSHQSALLLASSFPAQQNKVSSSKSQDLQSALSVVTILCSVLDLLAAECGFLHDCIHVGWSIQTLLFSVSHFTLGEDYHLRERELRTLSACNHGTDSMWEYTAGQLDRLYCNVWGRERQQHQSAGATEKFICYESRNDNTGARMVVLMPPFKAFIASLIKFACNLHYSSTESNGVTSFCQFMATKVFDRYAQAIQSPPSMKIRCDNNDHSYQNEISIVSCWIIMLVSNLQKMVSRQKVRDEKNEQKRGEMAELALTEKILTALINPVLRNLHLQIMQRALCSTAPRCQKMNNCPNCKTVPKHVASVFVDLYKQEVKKFLNKPSPAKTRRWGVYRTCLEKVFGLTPRSILFACPGHPGLSEYSANVLEDIWNQYGLSHSISIMVAAGLHVNASSTSLTSDMLHMREDDLSQQLKQLYNTFSSRAKHCIINTYKCFNAGETKDSQEQSLANFNDLVRFVRRELSIYREAEVGLVWWNEILADLFSLLKKAEEQEQHSKSGKSASNRDIAKAYSTLQNTLSVISGSN